MERQADIQSDEDNFDMLRTVFYKFKANRYLERAKRVARGQCCINLLKKTMIALKENSLKQTLMKLNQQEIEKTRKRRFFASWLAEYDKVQKREGAEVVMQFSLLHQVMQTWKKYTINQKKMKLFRTLNYETRLMQNALDLLKGNNVVNQFQRIAEMRIQEIQNHRLKKTALGILMLNSKREAIADKMHQYYLLKQKRKVTREWRAVVTERNE